MQPLRCFCASVVLVLIASIPTRAQGFISPFVGFNFGGDSTNCAALRNCEEHRTIVGLAIGSSHGAFGVEEDIAYAPQFFGKTPDQKNALLTAMSNLMVVIPAGPIQPYGVIGIGLVRPHMEFNATSLTLGKNALGWDIGAGLNLFLVKKVGVRGDVRRIKTLSDVTMGVFSSDKLEFWRGTAGLTFRF